jgi:mRNA interferase RelE/StbE
MAYEIDLSRQARKFLLGLRDARLLKRLEQEIDSLRENPFPHGSKKLQGADSLYRTRVGDHRIIYTVNQGRLLVLVVRIGDRKDVNQ